MNSLNGHASSANMGSIDGCQLGDEIHPSVNIPPFLQGTKSESKDNDDEDNTCDVQHFPPMLDGCALSRLAELTPSEQEQVLQSYAHTLKCMAGRGHLLADDAHNLTLKQRNQKARLFDKVLKKFTASSDARSAGTSKAGAEQEMKEDEVVASTTPPTSSPQNRIYNPKKTNDTKGTSKQEIKEDDIETASIPPTPSIARTSKKANDTKGADRPPTSSSLGVEVQVLPLSKLKMEGTALKKLYSHIPLDQHQDALRFCDAAALAVIQRNKKICSPTGFIIGALQSFEAKKMKNNNTCTSHSSSSKTSNDISESPSLSSSSSVLLPQSKMKLQDNALKTLHSIVPLDQHEQALLFCDAAAIRMFQRSQKIRNPTGFFIKTLQSFQNKMVKECAAATATRSDKGTTEAEPTASASPTPNTSFSDDGVTHDDDNNNNGGDDDRQVIAQLRREMDDIKGRLQAKSNQCEELKKQLESATTAQGKLQKMELSMTHLHDANVRKDDIITLLQETVMRVQEESQNTTKMLIKVQGELILAQQELMTNQTEHQAALSVETGKRQTMLAAKDLELQQVRATLQCFEMSRNSDKNADKSSSQRVVSLRREAQETQEKVAKEKRKVAQLQVAKREASNAAAISSCREKPYLLDFVQPSDAIHILNRKDAADTPSTVHGSPSTSSTTALQEMPTTLNLRQQEQQWAQQEAAPIHRWP